MIKIINNIRMIMAMAVLSVVLFSCVREETTCDKELTVVQRIGEGGHVYTRGTVISSNTDLKEETFGLYGPPTPNASVPQPYFNASATVNADLTAIISSLQYWSGLLNASMKFSSWYPYSDANAPTASLIDPGEMVLNYTANESAANHVDVLAAISGLVWVEGANIHFYYTLTKATFTLKKVAPVPNEVTIEKIEFQNVGKSGNLAMTEIPTTMTKNGKPKFVWSDVATGKVASTPTGNKTVTEDATLIGDTFLMLPTDASSATAKIVVTTNFGDREFLFSDILAKNPHSWESGEYINYNLIISNEIYQPSATPLEWTESPVNAIFDKQYYLKLSQTKVQTAGDGVTVNIEVKTNYDANPDTGFLPGASLNKSTMDTWPTVNMTQISLSEGVHTYNIQVVMPRFNSGTGTKRETGFYINVGNLRHHVLLSQRREDGEWLTSNVELDSNDNGIGNMRRRKIVFTSGNPGIWEWKITQTQDPDKILLNSETMLETSGVSGDAVYFYFRADAVFGDTARLILTNMNGDNLPITVTLTAP